MICPRCSVAEISPLTHRCELCGFAPEGPVVVEAPHSEAPPVEVVDALAHKELAGRFRLGACFSRGATSAMYLAREPASARAVVLKVLLRPTEGRAKADEGFRNAIGAGAAAARLGSMPVLDSGWTDHLYWYSMEQVRERSLRTVLLSLGPVAMKAWRRIVALMTSVLDHVRPRGDAEGADAEQDDGEWDALRDGADEHAQGAVDAAVGDRPGEVRPDGGAGRAVRGEGRSDERQRAQYPRRDLEAAGAGQGGGDRATGRGGADKHAGGEGVALICPNCAAGQISPLTHRCELCGSTPEGVVAVEAPRTEAIDDLARQELAEQFRLDTFLGRGAATAVYLARAQGSDREIVVKVLPRPVEGRSDADARFRRAVESVAALEHPHIVPVFDHGWTEHLYWYSMEYVRGRSLRNFLLQRGPLDLKACLRVTAQVASALDHAHRRGVVHGALKPENMLIDADGWVHLCDLLVRRALEQRSPAASQPPPAPGAPAALATSLWQPGEERPRYSAPEDLWTPSADQYVLAVIVTECLTGVPHGESGRAVQTAHLAASLPDIPPHVRQAIERALSPKPMDRFGSVLDFVSALETYTAPGRETQPSGRSSIAVLRQTDWKPPGRGVRWRLILGGAVAVAAAVVVWQHPVVLQAFRQVLSSAQSPGEPIMSDGGGEPAGRRPQAEGPRPRARPGGLAPASLPASSSMPGYLFVNATPWGQLYIDGQLVGNTPKANIVLSAGSHVVRVLREGYDPFERIIGIAAGQTMRLTDITLVQRP